jgi:hypothetical protein
VEVAAVTAHAVANRMEDTLKLTDTQLVILSRAAQREDRAAEIPDNLKGGAAQKVVTKLLRDGILEEVPAKAGMPVWRKDEQNGSIALLITPTGLEALGIECPQAPDPSTTPALQTASPGQFETAPDGPEELAPGRQVPRDGTKLAIVVSLLQQPAGASIKDLTAATSWLPHTTRAALTGLRKRGYEISKAREENGPTRYHIGTEQLSPSPASLDHEAACSS